MLDRADQFTLEIDTEASFGAGGAFAGAELVTRVWDVSLDGARHAPIQDECYILEGGSSGSYPGLADCRDGGVSWKHYLEGLGTNGGAGAPTATGLSHLLALLFQTTMDLLDGSSVDVYTSTTAFTEDDDDAHLPTGAIGLTWIELDSGISVCRPYTYTALTDALALLMAIPSVTSNSKRVWRAINYYWVVQPAATVSRGLRFVGASDELQAELKGAVLSAKIGSTSAGSIPVLECEASAADYADDYADTRAAGTNAYGAVMAGGCVAMAGYGNTVTTLYRASSVEIDFRGALTPVDQPDATHGTAGYARSHETPQATIRIPLEDVPPAAITAASFREAFDDNLVSGNDIQLLISFGATPGRQAAFYWSRARIVDWKRVDESGLAYQELVVGLVDGADFIGAQG